MLDLYEANVCCSPYLLVQFCAVLVIYVSPDFHHSALKTDFSRVSHLWKQLRLRDLFELFASRVCRLFYLLLILKYKYIVLFLFSITLLTVLQNQGCVCPFSMLKIAGPFLKISPIASGNSLPETRDRSSDCVPFELWSSSVFLQQELHCTAKRRMFNEVCLENCYKWLDEKLESRHEELSIENN